MNLYYQITIKHKKPYITTCKLEFFVASPNYGHFPDKVLDFKYKVIKNKLNVTEFIEKSRKLYDALPRETDLKISA